MSPQGFTREEDDDCRLTRTGRPGALATAFLWAALAVTWATPSTAAEPSPTPARTARPPATSPAAPTPTSRPAASAAPNATSTAAPNTTSRSAPSAAPSATSTAVPSATPRPAASAAPSATPGPAAPAAPGPSLPAARSLAFQEAVVLALETNVNVLLATERVNEARALDEVAHSPLLPRLSLSLLQANVTQNLAALGLTGGFLPGGLILGPYGTFDMRLHLVQSVFNESAVLRARVARQGVGISKLEVQLARQQVIAAAALAYVSALRAGRAEDVAQSSVGLARSLSKLARDQRESGLASGLDVTRAETRVTEELLRLEQSRRITHSAMLQLEHTVGLPLDAPVLLADSLQYVTEAVPAPEAAVGTALDHRVEVRLALERVALLAAQVRVAQAGNHPTVQVYGEYGMNGNTPLLNDYPTHNVGIQVQVPIYDGGQTRGEVAAAASRLRQAQIGLRDLRVQIEQDVREAVLTIQIAAEQVQTAQQSVVLAERELKMARDRFAAGLGDNIEVLNAQTSLVRALDARVAALAQHGLARVNLASATGRLESFEWAR